MKKGVVLLEEFNIILYEKDDGTCPIIEFLDSLDVKMRAKVMRLLLLLKKNGNELREPYSKELEDGIFELRAKQGTNITRVLYFFMIGRKIVVTNGFIKKSQKTPRRVIELAKTYRMEYMKRKESCYV